MSAVTPIRPKPHFRLKRMYGPWLIEGKSVVERWLPMCTAHGCWPCRECGTSHFAGCQCDFCPPVPQRSDQS